MYDLTSRLFHLARKKSVSPDTWCELPSLRQIFWLSLNVYETSAAFEKLVLPGCEHMVQNPSTEIPRSASSQQLPPVPMGPWRLLWTYGIMDRHMRSGICCKQRHTSECSKQRYSLFGMAKVPETRLHLLNNLAHSRALYVTHMMKLRMKVERRISIAGIQIVFLSTDAYMTTRMQAALQYCLKLIKISSIESGVEFLLSQAGSSHVGRKSRLIHFGLYSKTVINCGLCLSELSLFQTYEDMAYGPVRMGQGCSSS
ncbi:hypothetical protein BJ878DRAFT_481504 [Calycina marina]|uniref:Uncharacterized protein n=1 Tax=Calycina marina TaxID=1763456 RepID=A0A9P7Z0C0_9HELO|nr:hypothetical protein BJ878DRAFT_481504 [Calycina marina]